MLDLCMTSLSLITITSHTMGVLVSPAIWLHTHPTETFHSPRSDTCYPHFNMINTTINIDLSLRRYSQYYTKLPDIASSIPGYQI